MPSFDEAGLWADGLHFSPYLSVLKSLMIPKRNCNDNSSSYAVKIFLMQELMLLPATNISSVNIGSWWPFKDRKQVFSVFNFPSILQVWWDISSCSFFFSCLYFLLVNAWVGMHMGFHMTSCNLIALFHHHICPLRISFLSLKWQIAFSQM